MIEGIKGGPPPLRGPLRARAPGAGFHLPALRPEAPPPGAALGGAGLIGLQQGWTPAESEVRVMPASRSSSWRHRRSFWRKYSRWRLFMNSSSSEGR